MQLYSLIQNGNNILSFRNAFINLAISLYLITEPFPKKANKDKVVSGGISSKVIPDGWSVWDRINIKGPMTVLQFCVYMTENYKVKITGIKDDDSEVDIINTIDNDEM
jgi:hypothetical protein